MTVGELINLLSMYNSDKNVVIVAHDEKGMALWHPMDVFAQKSKDDAKIVITTE